jgi:hypothetical protein
MTDKVRAIKLARPDGWDFHTGQTINYRENIGKSVKPPMRDGDRSPILCSNTVIHACKNPNDCFVGAKIPCSAYVVRGVPRVDDGKKMGFTTLHVEREVTDLDTLFGWRYSEVINPINPFTLPMVDEPTRSQIESLKQWDSVNASVNASVRASVRDSVNASVRASVRDSVGASVWDSVWASVRAYIGSMFPNIEKWKYVTHEKGKYPFQPAVDLWKQGLVPSYDGKVWRLHSGPKAKVVYEWRR